jgi:hypothetical protein
MVEEMEEIGEVLVVVAVVDFGVVVAEIGDNFILVLDNSDPLKQYDESGLAMASDAVASFG